jgi:hypothetical protein
MGESRARGVEKVDSTFQLTFSVVGIERTTMITAPSPQSAVVHARAELLAIFGISPPRMAKVSVYSGHKLIGEWSYRHEDGAEPKWSSRS